jgi:nicotinate-nucleotide adenylyltransferase
MANDTHRLAMLGLDPLPQGSRLELCEIQRNAMSYTHQTLLLLAHQHPEHTFIFLIGSDNLAQFHTWDCAVHPVCPPFMLKEFPFYVYPRGGYPMSPLMEGMVPLTNLPEMTISSTEIRERARQGRSLAGLVTPKVAQYIEQHHLYHS